MPHSVGGLLKGCDEKAFSNRAVCNDKNKCKFSLSAFELNRLLFVFVSVPVSVHLCVCACVCVSVRACVRVRARVRVCV